MPSAGAGAHDWQVRHARALPFLLLAFGLAFWWLERLAPGALVPASLALFLLGIPHGAVERDPLDRLMRGRALAPSLIYSALYVVCGILVFASWLIAPWPTLIIALGLSAWHFALPARESAMAGLFVVAGSLAVFPGETLGIFNTLTAQPIRVAEPWLVATGVAAIALLWLAPGRRRDWPVRLALSALFLAVHPVAAVACYFFLCHSLGETAALLEQERGASPQRTLLRVYAPTSLPALLGASALLSLTWTGYVPIDIAAGLAVAFIVPHMLPVEQLLRVDRMAGPPG